MRLKPAHPVQEDFDFFILLNIILFIRYTEETVLKYVVVCFCNFEVFSLVWFQKISMIALLTNQLFLVFVAFSVSCLGLLCHFLSPVVLVVSLFLILFSLLVSS